MDKVKFDELRDAMAEAEKLQQVAYEFDKRLIKKEQRGEIVTNIRTIEEQEKLLFEKLNAKKISLAYFYSHLRDIFDYRACLEYFEMASPCKIIDEITEIVIPDSYFYSFYIIPLAEEQKNYNWNYDKELVFYITSRDGKNVYIADFLNGRFIKDQDYRIKIGKEISFYRDGIIVFEDDVVRQCDKDK